MTFTGLLLFLLGVATGVGLLILFGALKDETSDE